MSRYQQLEVRDVVYRDGHTLRLTGELDLSGVPTLGRAVTLAAAGSTRAITLDLGRLRFIDSSGVGAILATRDLCRKNGYCFALTPGSAPVQRFFQLTRFDEVLPFMDGNDGRPPDRG